MPTKPPPDENLAFLWTCLKNSDYKKIDMHAVAKTLNIKPGAAGTRFYRLKQRMEPEAGSPMKGVKRDVEEAGMDGEEEGSPKKQKRATAAATAKGKGNGKGEGKGEGKGKEASGVGEAKIKDEVVSGNEVGNGEEGGEGGRDGDGDGGVFS